MTAEPKGRILANALSYLAGQGAMATFGMVSSVVLARYLPKAVFGEYFYLLALAIIFMPFIDMGGHTLYAVLGARDRSRIGVSWSRAIAVKLWSLPLMIVLMGAYFIYSTGHIGLIFMLTIAYTVAQSMLLSTDVAFRPAEQGRAWAVRRVVYETSAFVMICIAVVAFHVQDVERLLLIPTAAVTVAVTWSIFTVVSLTGLTRAQFVDAIRKPFDREEIRALWPFALNTILWVFYLRATNLFLQNLGHHPETELADFRVIFVIMTSVCYMPRAIIWAAVPRIAFHDENENREEFRTLVRQFSGVNTWLAAVFTLGGLLYGERLIGIVYGHKYAHLGLAWTLFDLVLGLTLIQQFCTDLLNGIRMERQVVRGLLAGISILTLASLIFIPRYGTIGAAAAQLLASGFMVPINFYALARRVGWENLHGVKLLRLGAACAISAAVGYFLLQVNFYLSLVVFLVVIVGSSSLLGALPEHFADFVVRVSGKLKQAWLPGPAP